MWSAHYWFVLYSIAKEVSKEEEPDEKEVKAVIDGICLRVPCDKCRGHYRRYVVDNPLDVKNIVQWMNKYRQSTKPVVKVKKSGGCCGRKVENRGMVVTMQKRMHRLR